MCLRFKRILAKLSKCSPQMTLKLDFKFSNYYDEKFCLSFRLFFQRQLSQYISNNTTHLYLERWKRDKSQSGQPKRPKNLSAITPFALEKPAIL